MKKMKNVSFVSIVLTLLSVQALRSQDSSFTPFAKYDSATGNYVVTYWKDSTGKKYQTLFVPRTKIRPTITTRVSSVGTKLSYSYTITNGLGGKQPLIGFDLQVVAPLDTVLLPYGWLCDHYRYESYLQFAHRPKRTTDVLLGQSLDLSTVSKGLPSIIITRFLGRATESPYSQAFEFEPGEDVYRLLDSLEFKIRGNHDVQVKTIGPADPPSPFTATVFLDTLLSYTRQSAELGWLGRSRDDDCDDDERPDDGITKNIEKRLEKAKKELSKGDSTKARKELEKLVDKVERIWKRSQDEENKHKGEQRERKQDMIMTGEAYALLLYNTEYLIDRLPDGKEKKGEKEKKGGDKDDD
jgi:uncharacterized protein YceK/ElaB/YqjD/DUF883 family membrane-anchored ribosome-binding protein